MPLPGLTAAAPDAADQLDELRALHEEGRIAAEYPRVRGLLTGLAPAQLKRAGQLLARLDPGEVRQAHPRVPVSTVAITGHGTLADLVPLLAAELARHGIALDARVSAFDSYVFDLADPGSDLYAAEPDLTLCVLDPRIVLDELPVRWGPGDVERVLADKLALLEGLVETHGSATSGPLVLNTLPLPHTLPAQLVDHRSRATAAAHWHEANARLLRLVADHEQLTVLDTAPWLAAGVPADDARLSVYVKAHLSSELLAEYAREAGHLVRHLTGHGRKVLAVDLDGTLWGGVLGEDGPDGIEAAGGHRGEAFRLFQRVLAQLSHQGVLLAAVSKNDLEPVREVLASHPGMTLREDDFVRVIANWEPKHANLRRLAEELGLGIDSIAFVDDSSFECGLVRHELPEVAVVPLDDDPATHVGRLLRDGWFDTRSITAEDLARPQRYREELERNDFLHNFSSVEDYLAGLGVTVELSDAEPRDLPRVSQLTMRTNQFNLTTVRLAEHDVRRIVADPSQRVLTIRSADRFGDNGLVGAIFISRVGTVVRIDNFLLSCRVFSRGIEQSCLTAVLDLARAQGATEVLASYRHSPKNGKVADFYPRAGFTVAGGGAEDGGVQDAGTAAEHFRHDLAALPESVAHIRLRTGFDPSKGLPQ